MNKEELIELKEKLDSELYVLNEKEYDTIKYSEYLKMVNKHPDASIPVMIIENEFKKMMLDYANRDIEFDKITIKPKFSIILTKNDVSLDGYLTNPFANPEPIVEIEIEEYRCGEDIQFWANRKEGDIDGHYYYVYFNEFIEELEAEGFELKRISSLDTIRNRIFNGEPPMGEITINFNKEIEEDKKTNTLRKGHI